MAKMDTLKERVITQVSPDLEGARTQGSAEAPTKQEGAESESGPQQINIPVTEATLKTEAEAPQKGFMPEGFYTDWFERHSPHRPPTDEELEKERKKQKREAIFSAIGDGISALSNLYFTTQYAPSHYDGTRGMSAATKARFDKLKEDRERNQREYMAGWMKAANMDQNTYYKDQLADVKQKELERKQQEQDRKERESNINIALKEAELALKDKKLQGQEYLNHLYELRAEAQAIKNPYLEREIQAKINRINRTGTGGSGGRKYYGRLPDEDGNMVDYYSKADYEAALNEDWRDIEQDRPQVTKSSDGTTTTKPKTKSTGEKAGEAMSKKKKKKTGVNNWK